MSSMYLTPVSPTSLAFFTSLEDYRRLSTDFRLTESSPYVMPLNDIGDFRGKEFQKLPTLRYSPLVKSMTGQMGSMASRGQVTDHTFRFASGFVGTKSQSCRGEVTVDVGSLLLPFLECLAPLPADGSEAEIFRRDVLHNKNLRASVPLPEFANLTQPQCRSPTDVCEDLEDGEKETGSAMASSANERSHAPKMVNRKEVFPYPSDKSVIKYLACEEPKEPSYVVLNVAEEVRENEPLLVETADVTHVTDMMAKKSLLQNKKLPTFNCNILRRSRLRKKLRRKIRCRLPRDRCVHDLLETCCVDGGKLNWNHKKGADRNDPLGIETSRSMPSIIDSAFGCTELLDFNKLPLQTGCPHFVSESLWSGVVDSDWEVQEDSHPPCAEMSPLAFTASPNQDIFCQNAAIAFIIGCMDETTDESDWNSEAEGDSWSDDLWDFTCPLQLQNLSGHVPPHPGVTNNGNEHDRTTAVDSVTEVQPLCIINCPESSSGGMARLDDVNSHWNTTMDTINIECPRQSKVHFAKENLETVYIVTDWPDDYQAARMGPWEQFARDTERFQNRIRDIEPILSPCLNPEHRKKVFERIKGNGQS